MFSSPIFWIALALALFWAVGAYNRLVRLRSAVLQAFGGLDAHFVRLLAMLAEYDAAQAGAPAQSLREALQAAATQFTASLAVARARPLHADAAAALSTALTVLEAAWAGTEHPDPPPPPPGPAVPPWAQRWEQHAAQNTPAIVQFNDAVAQYNAAIAQFPAQLLAWLFGFQAARAL
ncbi:LemA family protein [Acidovorax sp. SRB_14]|uniref:LemA family protein n=1 Tax=unclassified Acidovorax TaxID=2684926 RepID=UPI00145CB36F|nr:MULTISPECIES: LemA family protein [unclassified Acidovorax]NMM78018.1 LemA family protein [Acidovorax sp. SRB_24]NMM82578.1 LemA family protein [Acidovorax sp. SRB_14]NMM91176.1 LemA family protein [Rhodococcus sp. SRB_17]